MIRFRTLGTPDLTGADGHTVGSVLAGPKRVALLAYLALEGANGLVRRDTLLPLFWPESDTDRARASLRSALLTLRRSLGEGVVVSRGDEEVGIGDGKLWCDAVEFRQALAAGETEQALALYRGDFLQGFFLSEAPEFERWAEVERDRLARLFAQALEDLAERSEAKGNFPEAARWWRRLAAHDPHSSRVALRLMLTLEAAGDRASALQHARVHEALLREELGTNATSEVHALAERLQQEPPARSFSSPAAVEPVPELPATVYRPKSEPSAPGSLPHARSWFRRWGLGAAAVAVGSVLLAVLADRRRAEPPRGELRVAVAPFAILDPAFRLWREGVMDVLSRSLDGAGSLRAVPPTLVVRRWEGRPDASSADALGQRTGADLVVYGTVLGAGRDSVRLSATVRDVTRRRTLTEIEVRDEAGRMDRALDSLAVAVLREIGRVYPVRAVRVRGTPSASLPALKAYLQAEQAYRHGDFRGAEVLAERALALDPGLGLAAWRLSRARSWQAHPNADDRSIGEYALRAGALTRGMAPRDSLLLRADSVLTLERRTPPGYRDPALGRRHFALRREAARRFAHDPEVWYELGEALVHHGEGVRATGADALRAFRRAIALDPEFIPAYYHAIQLALLEEGPHAARILAERFLRLSAGKGPSDVRATVELILSLLPPEPLDSARLRDLLDTVPTPVAEEALVALTKWPDSAETAVRVGRVLASRSAHPRFHPDPARTRRLFSQALDARGHLRAGGAVLGTPHPGRFAEFALLGTIPVDSAERVLRKWLREGDPLTLLFSAPWWSERGDTLALRQSAARLASAPRGPLTDFARAAALAHLALARRDSSEALNRFVSLPFGDCYYCTMERLTAARLLRARGRVREAAALLAPGTPAEGNDSPRPSDVLLLLERAQVAEALGDRQRAAAAYRRVAELWAHGDPEVQPFVVKARAGLRRTQNPSSAAAPD